MKIKSISAIIFLLASLISASSVAEPPCNRIGHETLAGALACAEAYAKSGQIDASHRQLLDAMSSRNILPPQTTPIIDYPPLIPYAWLIDFRVHGFRNMHLMYPYSYYMFMGSPYHSRYPLY